MRIPKYILHPSLILLAGAFIMWLVWTRVPSANDVVTSLPAAATNKMLPDPKQLTEIADTTETGEIILKNSGRKLRLDEVLFAKANADERIKLKKFFIGKLVRAPADPTINTLSLPVELYDPLCFKSDAKILLHCPIILEK